VSQSQTDPASLLARTTRGAGWVLAWRWGMRLLGLISTLVLVRLIRPADFGIIALATGFVQTIDGMLTLGTEEAVIRAPNPTRSFYDTAFTLNLLRGLFVSACVAALAWPAARFFADPRLGPVLLVIAALPLLDGCANIGTVEFRRDFAFQKEFAIMVLPKLCGVIAAITAAVVTRSYVAMLLGMGTNRSMRVVMSYVMHPYRPCLSLRARRALAFYSVWTWVLSLAVLVRDRTDSLVLGRVMGTAAVGFYAVGAEIAALPTTELLEPLGRAAFSGFAAGRKDGAAMLPRLMGVAAVIGLPAGLGLSLVAAPLVHLAFGPGWQGAVPVLRVLAVGFTALVFGHLCLNLLSAHAHLQRLAGIALAAAAGRIALLLLLTPLFGLVGCALAASAGMLLEQGLTLRAALTRFDVPARALLRETWRPASASLAMATALAGVGLGWTDDTAVSSLIQASLLGAIVYLATLVATWLAAGRPEGAEADVLRLLRRLRRNRCVDH
jgi:lipopolysaccharide exporter